MVHVVTCKSIAEARLKSVKLIWEEGEDHWDERGELTREIKNLVIWLKGNNRQPAEQGLQAVLGEDFRYGLLSDEGARIRGEAFDYGYGLELRENDMLNKTVQKLKKNPETRRAYIPIFKPRHVDSPNEVPCFVGLELLLRDDALDMTMFSRSNESYFAMINDIYGFSGVQDWAAKKLGCEVGDYTQHAVSAHLRVNSDMDGIQALLAHA